MRYFSYLIGLALLLVSIPLVSGTVNIRDTGGINVKQGGLQVSGLTELGGDLNVRSGNVEAGTYYGPFLANPNGDLKLSSQNDIIMKRDVSFDGNHLTNIQSLTANNIKGNIQIVSDSNLQLNAGFDDIDMESNVDLNNNNLKNVGSCSGCDLAESIDSEDEYEKGTVISISDTQDNTVEISDEEYDTEVVGVVSTNPVINMGSGDGGVDMGVTGKELNTSDGEVPVALAGVVPVKVNDENGDIERGDAIVPSSTDGVGMKADPSDNRYSDLAVIGKAMEPLEDDEGKINVLVN